ncbi:MAG: XrtA system polysaccharide deacetylase [Gemmatimonadaceae bacterium]
MNPRLPNPSNDGRHVVTVALEDYYHVGAFHELIQRGEWYRFESRLEASTRRTLELLEAYGARATFFTLGWVADVMPELVREVAERGHEVASKGYYHRDVSRMSPEEFREDLARAREALRRATGQAILGYRVAESWFGPRDEWALDVLADEGYAYDSSTAPMGFDVAPSSERRYQHAHHFGDRTMQEFPISTMNLGGWLLPIGGGNYVRQLPPWFVHLGVNRWMRQRRAPFVLYFHAWELDPEQPRISAASFSQRVRHYRNLARMEGRLEWFLSRWRFMPIAEYLGLSTVGDRPAEPLKRRPASVVDDGIDTHVRTPVPQRAGVGASARTPVTVVVPCYNEELILPYLANTLKSVEERLGARYAIEYVFVDDGSTDATFASLQRLFGARAESQVLQMRENTGVAGAILRGITAARTEIVCSIDCDCTYDPHRLAEMIPLLTDDVSMVTASPYHADGHVRNVPDWRLFLSRNLSWLYRRVLHNKLATYTSCFRVYRRSRVAGVPLTRGGFLGVTELLCRLDLSGDRIVEFPATLEVRIIGRSKLKVLRTILGHLRLLAGLIPRRWFGRHDWVIRTAMEESGRATGAGRETSAERTKEVVSGG